MCPWFCFVVHKKNLPDFFEIDSKIRRRLHGEEVGVHSGARFNHFTYMSNLKEVAVIVSSFCCFYYTLFLSICQINHPIRIQASQSHTVPMFRGSCVLIPQMSETPKRVSL